MKLSEIKKYLNQIDDIIFLSPDGQLIPPNFHVTEIGQINKRFVDCGGKYREDTVVNFQLWVSDDCDHRLSVSKLKSIIESSEKKLDLNNSEIEIEYQEDTIGKYGLDFKDGYFILVNTLTNCLAKNSCKIDINNQPIESECSSESNCC